MYSSASRTEKNLKVSVLMITYNHEEYIEQAVLSVMMQTTDFDYELVIGEDCSTDRTREIVMRLKEEFPLRIRLLLHEKNVGMIPNFVATYQACEGEYVAILEGDDFWIDRFKLQKQVQFLETNREYVLVGSNALVLFENSGTLSSPAVQKTVPFDFETRELILRNPLPTLTAMFRNGIISEFPDLFFQGSGCDRQIWILLSLHGKCHFDPDVTAIYRKHERSSTSTRASSYQLRKLRHIETLRNAQAWNEFLGSQYVEEVNDVRQSISIKLFKLALRNADLHYAASISPLVNERSEKLRVRIAVRMLRMIHRYPQKSLLLDTK